MENIIEARNLSTQLDGVKVLNAINFEVNEGECVGILGPYRSGKTTFLEALSCQRKLDSGEIFVNGVDAIKYPETVKYKMGFIPENENFDLDFNVIDNLILFASYFNITKKESLKRAHDLLNLMGIETLQNFNPQELDINQLKKLSFCRALITHPEILLVDEPTKGLCLEDQSKIHYSLIKLKESLKTLIIASEDIADVEDVCDRVLIFSKGKIIAVGNPKDLIKEHIGEEVIEFSLDRGDLEYYISKLSKEYEVKILDKSVRLFLKNGQSAQEVIKMFSSKNILIRRASLDDVYLKMSDSNTWQARV